jgi:hypothetical protein
MRDLRTRSFGIHAFGCNVYASTTCAEAYAVLEQYVFPTLPRVSGTAKQPDILIRIDRAADRFCLFADDGLVASEQEAISLVPEIIRAVDDAVIRRLTPLRAIHAGVVVWNGRALLLPGTSHAGKSSLVAEFLRRGATYFSDEYALIDPQGRVHPYPRPLLVRNGSPEQFPVLPRECNAAAGDSPAPVGLILLLQYLPGCNWSLTSVSQSEALLMLLRNTPHVLAETPDLVEIFQRVVAGAPCYTGRRDEASHAVDKILRLVDQRAA